MKKLIGMVIASLLFSNIGFAAIAIIDGKQLKTGSWVNIRVDTVCVDGYKFVVSRNHSGTISMVQSMRKHVGVDRKYILPQEC